MTYTILFSLLAAAVGAAIAYLAARGRIMSHETKAELLKGENDELRKEVAEGRKAVADLSDERASLMSRRDVLQSRVDGLIQQMEALHQHYEKQLAKLEELQAEQMDRQSALIREQINSASEEILKKRSEELSTANHDQLSAILHPFQEKLSQMREAVERSDRELTTTMERLDASIKANLQQAREVGERADKLAQALTADNKAQGNFGELRLRTLLESMGFEEGMQFEEQVTLKDETGGVIHEEDKGRRMVPDVILHFPDKRDVIIDSKVSMKAFEEYFQTDDEGQRLGAAKRHVASVRNHVRELAHKNYSRYIHGGRQRPDFVIMYVYSESALQLALTHDPSLYREAYDEGVIISGSQNMYMMLRVLEMTWRQVRQAENQEEIMRAADELVSRVQLFYERFLLADEQLKRTQEAFNKLRTTTAPTGASIVTAAHKLLDYGAKENTKRRHRLPKAAESDDTQNMK